MFIVTGGYGLVGSALIARLNEAGIDDILVVDSLKNGDKYKNLQDRRIADFEDREVFFSRLGSGKVPDITAIFHQGALTDMLVTDGERMMAMNYAASRALLDLAVARKVPMVYASSAAVYGLADQSSEDPVNERPLNIYGYSKKLFDDFVRRRASGPDMPPIVGLRYFNVYGPREQHKGKMASVALRLIERVRCGETAAIFGASGGIGPGEHRRDFVHVDDVAAVIEWAFTSGSRGIFNCGTGLSPSFLELATTVIDTLGTGEIEFLPFPEVLEGRYQNNTRADLTRLRAAGCPVAFRDISRGIPDYVSWLDQRER